MARAASHRRRMLGCGHCDRCRAGHHVCADLAEIGPPGALAEQRAVPATALHHLPDTVDPTLGAFVEPEGNATSRPAPQGFRAV
ncbi:hypothetical protein ACIBP6_03340 [Nonomuraea terrae]|uniref:hypothetical protein n=1 Tax=Nonomuraea terrae TaxID=2530383 RepID=UPI00378DEDB6